MPAVPRQTEDSHASLASRNRKRELRFVICGSADDGKSTLLDRLLHDSRTVLRDRSSTTETENPIRGAQGDAFDFALTVDGLQEEPGQGAAIDVAYRQFESDRRKFIAIDATGREQHTRTWSPGRRMPTWRSYWSMCARAFRPGPAATATSFR